MDAGKLFVLKDMADHVGKFDVGADGELAHAVAVFVGVGVTPEVVPKLSVFAPGFSQTVLFDAQMKWRMAQVAVPGAEVIANHTIDNKCSVNLAGRGEDLATGQIAPFLRTDNAAGLKPPVRRIEFGGEIGASSGGRGDLPRIGDDAQDLPADCVNPLEIRAHALHHDLLV